MKTYKVTLNGKTYEVEVEKGEAILKAEYDAMATASAPAAAPVAAPAAPSAAAPAAPVVTGSGETVKAPLPGTVSAVKVNVGDTVKKGQQVVVIEAMKMENDIQASKDGKITGIYVTKGQSLERGVPLFSIA